MHGAARDHGVPVGTHVRTCVLERRTVCESSRLDAGDGSWSSTGPAWRNFSSREVTPSPFHRRRVADQRRVVGGSRPGLARSCRARGSRSPQRRQPPAKASWRCCTTARPVGRRPRTVVRFDEDDVWRRRWPCEAGHLVCSRLSLAGEFLHEPRCVKSNQAAVADHRDVVASDDQGSSQRSGGQSLSPSCGCAECWQWPRPQQPWSPRLVRGRGGAVHRSHRHPDDRCR